MKETENSHTPTPEQAGSGITQQSTPAEAPTTDEGTENPTAGISPDDTSQGGITDDPPANPSSDPPSAMQTGKGKVKGSFPEFRVAMIYINKKQSPLFSNYASDQIYALVPHALSNVPEMKPRQTVTGIKIYLSELTFLYGGANNSATTPEVFPITYENRVRVFFGQTFIAPQVPDTGTTERGPDNSTPELVAAEITYFIIHDVRQVYTITDTEKSLPHGKVFAKSFFSTVKGISQRYFMVVARPIRTILKPMGNMYYVGIIATPRENGTTGTPQLYDKVSLKPNTIVTPLAVYDSKAAQLSGTPQALLSVADTMQVIK